MSVLEEVQLMMKPGFEKLPLGQPLPPGFPAPFLFADGLSSVDTLLTNIQVALTPDLWPWALTLTGHDP